MSKGKFLFLVAVLVLGSASFIHLKSHKFHFKSGAYKTYVIDTEIHPFGVTDYISGQNGYHHIYDKDSTEHENCQEIKDKFSWTLDGNRNQFVIDNYVVWLKDSCGAELVNSKPFKQYFNIIHQSKDSLVTRHLKDVFEGETHFYHNTDTSLYIWVWDSKLTNTQKKLVKKR